MTNDMFFLSGGTTEDKNAELQCTCGKVLTTAVPVSTGNHIASYAVAHVHCTGASTYMAAQAVRGVSMYAQMLLCHINYQGLLMLLKSKKQEQGQLHNEKAPLAQNSIPMASCCVRCSVARPFSQPGQLWSVSCMKVSQS